MPSYAVRALVLRKTKLGETDTILTLLSQDGTQLRAVAKGLRRPGSKFGARLEPFAVVDLLLHTGRSLEVVSEARSVEPNAVLREDLERSAAAAVVVDLLDKIGCEGQSEPRLYGLATTTLSVMSTTSTESLPALVVAYLIKALAMQGYRPELEACAACACHAGGAAGFSLEHGGVLCPACGELDPGALELAENARAWMISMLGSTMAEVAVSEMPHAAVADCFTLVRSFVGYHVPARLKALDYYAGFVRNETAGG